MATLQQIVEISLRHPVVQRASNEVALLSPDEIAQLTTAHRAAQAAEHVRFRNDVAALAAEITRCASSLEAALDQMTKEICQLAGVTGATVALRDRSQFRCWARYGLAPDLGIGIDSASTISRSCISSKSIVIATAPALLRGYLGACAVLALPLMRDDE